MNINPDYKDLLYQSSEEHRKDMENRIRHQKSNTNPHMEFNQRTRAIADKARKHLAKKWLKEPPSKLQPIDLSTANFVPPGMTRGLHNNRYIVTIYDNMPTSHGPATKIMVQKIDNTPITFHWREMQKIKNELFGEQTWAVEYYPAESELENTHNIYWMFVYPDGVLPVPLST